MASLILASLQGIFRRARCPKDATAESFGTRFTDLLEPMPLAKGRIEGLAGTEGIGNVDGESF